MVLGGGGGGAANRGKKKGKQALIQVKYGDAARVLQSEQHKKRGKTGQVKYGAGTNKVKYGAARVLRSEQHTSANRGKTGTNKQ